MHKPLFEHIVDICASEYGVSAGAILFGGNDWASVRARHTAMFLSLEITGIRKLHLAKLFGRDRITINNAIIGINRVLERGGPEAEMVKRIRRIVEGVANG